MRHRRSGWSLLDPECREGDEHPEEASQEDHGNLPEGSTTIAWKCDRYARKVWQLTAGLYPNCSGRSQTRMISSFRLRIVFVVPCVMLIFSGRPGAQSPRDSHAKVELLMEQNAAPAGKPVWAGLLFRFDQGWHIYWQNPGDAGEPPKIQWQVPPGLSAGAILWPQPIRLGSGTVVDYGYENEVLLMAPIEAESQGRAVSIPSLSADVKYIVCREMCIPGRAHLTFALPAGGDWGPWRTLFEQTRRQLPKPAPSNWRL